MSRTTAVFAAAATAAAVAVVPGHAQAPGERTLTLSARSTQIRLADLAPRGRPSPGDGLVSLNRVTGAATGREDLHCAITRPARTFGRSTYQCAGTLGLADGTITFSLVSRLGVDRVVTAAITGGTGAYAGARGEVVNTTRSETVSDQVVRLLP